MSTEPAPSGCGLCGHDQRSHGIRIDDHGHHTYQTPTTPQIKHRLIARANRKTTSH